MFIAYCIFPPSFPLGGGGEFLFLARLTTFPVIATVCGTSIGGTALIITTRGLGILMPFMAAFLWL